MTLYKKSVVVKPKVKPLVPKIVSTATKTKEPKKKIVKKLTCDIWDELLSCCGFGVVADLRMREFNLAAYDKNYSIYEDDQLVEGFFDEKAVRDYGYERYAAIIASTSSGQKEAEAELKRLGFTPVLSNVKNPNSYNTITLWVKPTGFT